MENNIKTDDKSKLKKCSLNLSVLCIVGGKILLLLVCICVSFLCSIPMHCIVIAIYSPMGYEVLRKIAWKMWDQKRHKNAT